MARFTLPPAFQRSYTRFAKYPTNLILNGAGMYPSTLESLKNRLDGAEKDLCISELELEHFEVPIRDIRATTSEDIDVNKENLHSPNRLSNWLGAHFESVEKGIIIGSRRDPICRFVYIFSDTSRDPLKITRSSLAEILTYHQVMPAYLDFISVFGFQLDSKDIKFSSFRELNLIKDSPRNCAIPSLGRSGRQFQLCYNLKGVTHKDMTSQDIRLQEWSIRQAAIHHQFDIMYGTTLWIITKGRRDIYERFRDMTSKEARAEGRSFGTVEDCLRSSLAAHLLYCHWATQDWRGYILWLERVMDSESSMAVYGPRDLGSARKNFKSGDIQDLQYWQDKTNEAIIVLQSNVDIIASLRSFYQSLLRNKDFPDDLKSSNEDDIASFSTNLEELSTDFRVQIERAKLLAATIRERKGLRKILQHIQSQAAERTEQLNWSLEREALGMRIITIVTLLYLPATFVSTFFGTDVVKYQRQGDEVPGNGSFSPIAMKRWIQVTLPLTFLTVLLAWAIYRIETTKKNSHRQNERKHYQDETERLLSDRCRTYSTSSKLKGYITNATWTGKTILPFHST